MIEISDFLLPLSEPKTKRISVCSHAEKTISMLLREEGDVSFLCTVVHAGLADGGEGREARAESCVGRIEM